MNISKKSVLVLGGTGRTGSLIARQLTEQGLEVRTAARKGADVLFDWDDSGTYDPALDGVDRIYLVTPTMRAKYAGLVSGFLDLAETHGVRHVTFLSAYGSEHSPAEVDITAVERELTGRTTFTSTILRPAWVMQNFSDEHMPVMEDMITVPTGAGTEAFVDAADIAAVAVQTLLDPDNHAGAAYSPAGPDANGLALGRSGWFEAVDLESVGDANDAGLIFAGGERTARPLDGTRAGPVGAGTDEESRVKDLQQESSEG